ncbi:O-antigen polymerase [Photobacterium phosphoreum]|uniref:O-antigen polymerase n=1 Tax=Photobacterium phosphoreum TaxID=659 RepID=UPI0039B02224
MLILLNFLVWFTPIIIFKGKALYLSFVPIFLISSGYWIYPFIIELLGENYSSVIVKEQINNVLYYSAWAGLFFHVGFFNSNKLSQNNDIYCFSIKEILPPIKLDFFLKPIVFYLILYSFSEAIDMIGVSDRKIFVSEIRPFWYDVIIRINTLFLFIIVLYEYRVKRSRVSICFTFFLVLMHIILVGFDGSRRDALIPIFSYSIVLVTNYLNNTLSRQELRNIFIIIMFFVFLTSFLALGRSFPVGWYIILNIDFLLTLDWSNIIINILTPMPTLHVNTLMSHYVELNGYQGYDGYINAIGNTLFPRFIFDDYLFGQPMSLYLQDKFGWFGFDFGFLAEAIYSGGFLSVGIVHFFLGLILKYSITGIFRSSPYRLLLYVSIIFAITNSFRSDFMNFSKSFFYIWIALCLSYLILKWMYKNWGKNE